MKRFTIVALLASAIASPAMAASTLTIDTPLAEHRYRNCDFDFIDISRTQPGDVIIANCPNANHYQQAFGWSPSFLPSQGGVSLNNGTLNWSLCTVIEAVVFDGVGTSVSVECLHSPTFTAPAAKR